MGTSSRCAPALRPGDAVAVVAPAGIPPAETLQRGLELLGSRYTIRSSGRELSGPGWGMHSGPDDIRAAELRWALSEPDIRCVIAARGGYGTARLLQPEVINAVRSTNCVVVGFSDITVLHAVLSRHAGLRTIHGPMVCQLGRRGKGWACYERLIEMLEHGSARAPIAGLHSLAAAGRARGPLLGGNLTVLTHLVGTPHFPSLRGAVLLIEDVGERPYRLDRCLLQLEQAGALEGLAAVVVGDLTDCGPQGGEHDAAEIMARFCVARGVPALAGLPAGHGAVNEPLPLGAEVEVDADRGRLVFLEGVVEAG